MPPCIFEEALQKKIIDLEKKMKLICESYLKIIAQLKMKNTEIIQLKEVNAILERKLQLQNGAKNYLSKVNVLTSGEIPKSNLTSSRHRNSSPLLPYTHQLNHTVYGKQYDRNQITSKERNYQFSVNNIEEKFSNFKPNQMVKRQSLDRTIENLKNRIQNSDKTFFDIGQKQAEMSQKNKKYDSNKFKSPHFKMPDNQVTDRPDPFRKTEETAPDLEVLKQIWSQRDRQIQRMDELFQNLNKRINLSDQ